MACCSPTKTELSKKCEKTLQGHARVRTRKRRVGVLTLCVAAFAVAVISVPIPGLTGVVGVGSAQSWESILRIGFLQEIDSMNPYMGLNDASYVFYGLVYDALICVDEDLGLEPNLALEAWPVPEGYDADPRLVGMPYGSVWQYNLTHNAYWTDGQPFTADDVVFNIELNYQNYDAMWAYQPYSYFICGAWKLDDYRVRVSFWERATRIPMPAAYAHLISIPMLPKHLLAGLSPYEISFNWNGLWPNNVSPGMPIVGTGPFMATPHIYDEWLAGDHITLVKNPNYHWKADKGKEIKFNKLVMKFFHDPTSMTLALLNGWIDVAQLPPPAYRSLKNNQPPNIVTYDGPKVTQYWTEIGINMNNAGPNPSRLDPAIRHAMHMATNKDYIVENYYLGLADPGTTLIPPVNSYWHYEPTEAEKFKYNLTDAAALLEASGYRDTNGDGIRECTIDSLAVEEGWVLEGKPLQYQMLIRREYPEEKDIAAYLEGEWAKIGIDINYRILDESQLSTEVYSYTYDTMIWYWSADIDPNYQLFCLSSFSIGGWSDCKYISEAYDTNYTLSVATLDREQRKVYVDNCQKVFYQDSVYIILAYVYQTYAWRTDRFTGWGDWAAHPGRTVDNFWTGNPLYFDLMPVPPPTGYVVGLTLDSAGYEVPNCDIIITNLRTGAFNYTRSSSTSGHYEFDLNSMSGGWQDGDLIRVLAYNTPLGLMGQNESAIDADVGYVRIDVTLTSSQPTKPFYVSGRITDMEGNEVPNCDIVIMNTRTKAFNFTRSNASGHYKFDLNMMDGKWEDGDVIRVLAFNSTLTLMGQNESAIDASAGELIIDVTMAGVIPEFQSVLIPVTGLMIAVITVMVARRRRRR